MKKHAHIFLSTLTFGSETWTWNRMQQSRVRGVEMNDLRGACGVTGWESKSNRSMYERCGMGTCVQIERIVEWWK